MMSIDALVSEISEWVYDLGIYERSDPKSLMMKTVEEVGELAEAIGKEDRVKIKDGIGDVVVTLVLQAEMQHLSLYECVEHALNVISKRNGRMENGMFVKDEGCEDETTA